MPAKRVPLVVQREGLTRRVRRDIRPLMGSTITLPVLVGGLRVVVFVATDAFELKSLRAQDAAVRLVARRIADALEGKL